MQIAVQYIWITVQLYTPTQNVTEVFFFLPLSAETDLL